MHPQHLAAAHRIESAGAIKVRNVLHLLQQQIAFGVIPADLLGVVARVHVEHKALGRFDYRRVGTRLKQVFRNDEVKLLQALVAYDLHRGHKVRPGIEIAVPGLTRFYAPRRPGLRRRLERLDKHDAHATPIFSRAQLLVNLFTVAFGDTCDQFIPVTQVPGWTTRAPAAAHPVPLDRPALLGHLVRDPNIRYLDWHEARLAPPRAQSR
mmetsp:Transcript_38886/g.105508  ORF Transcript_38886/g.105508 Transcript_38886/m.105508 type:complete len:209 (+) Transcript_38886:49-675(+)